ncbi:MAG: type II secretion system protein [Verrucomicrobiota bacterium]
MHYNKTTHGLSPGFSLVEMLVVISVIGVIAGVSVPVIGNIAGTADQTASKRNAQLLSHMYASANQAGAAFPVATEIGVCNSLIDGVTGVYIPGEFQIRLDDEERDAAMAHLTFTDDMLLYTPDGGTVASAPPAPGFSFDDLELGLQNTGQSIQMLQHLASVSTDPAVSDSVQDYLDAAAFAVLEQGSPEFDAFEENYNGHQAIRQQFENGEITEAEYNEDRDYYLNGGSFGGNTVVGRDEILANAVQNGSAESFFIDPGDINEDVISVINDGFADDSLEMVFMTDQGTSQFNLVDWGDVPAPN